MDQSGNQAQMPCYASAHNHSLGGGSYGSEGLIRIFGSVQRAVRAVDPEAMLAGTCVCHTATPRCIPVVDGAFLSVWLLYAVCLRECFSIQFLWLPLLVLFKVRYHPKSCSQQLIFGYCTSITGRAGSHWSSQSTADVSEPQHRHYRH